MKNKIDFFIVGAQKSATTSIYEYLNSIDDVAMPIVKEMQVFTNEKLYENFPKNLKAFYEQDLQNKIVGMADVELLYAYEQSAERIYKHNQKAKIIIMLRNPIDRAYSSYWFSRKNQRENVSSFEEAIELEEERIQVLEQNDKLALTYLDVSMYYRQVKKYIDVFGEENVLVLVMEEFIKDKEQKFIKVLDFLHLDKNQFNRNILTKKFNEGGDVKSKSIQKIFITDNILRKMYFYLFPLSLRMRIRKNVINPLLSKNTKPYKYNKISEETYSKLKKYFNKDIKQLSKLLNKDLEKIWF
jgi:hypothetical protein